MSPMHVTLKAGVNDHVYLAKCVVPPTLWKLHLNASYIYIFWCSGNSSPPKIPIPSVGEVWIVSLTAQCLKCQ